MDGQVKEEILLVEEFFCGRQVGVIYSVFGNLEVVWGGGELWGGCLNLDQGWLVEEGFDFVKGFGYFGVGSGELLKVFS